MKCLLCSKYSIQIICNTCQNNHLLPKLSKRVLDSGLIVYSFYSYSDIKELLTFKHRYHGDKIYKILAQNSFKIFAKEFIFDKKVYALAVDDVVKEYYSHTAILANSLNSKFISPLYAKLIAKNRVNYSGKSLEYRLKNRRDFEYRYKEGVDIILVDDIVTTGTTLNEAKSTLDKNRVNTLFALTLADARQ